MRFARFAKASLILLAVAGSLTLLPSQGVAGRLTVNLADSEITSMSLTGTADLPLGTDVGGGLDGYGLVTTGVTVTESPSHVSTVQTTVVVTTADSFNFDFAVTATVNLFADLSFANADPSRNFAAGLGTSFGLNAPDVPMTVQLSDTFSLNALELLGGASISDPFSPTAIATTAVYPLGVDVNANGNLDVLKLDASALSFILNDISLSDLNVDSSVITDLLNGSDVTVNASLSLAITGTTVSFAGQVVDAISDPPFNITLSGPTNSTTLQSAVPEPASFVAGLMGLVAFVGVAVRYRRRAVAGQ